MLKLNLGCGFNKLNGFVNVDSFDACAPDIVHNLEMTPWPWLDNSVDEIRMIHSLEHMGASTEIFFNIIKELYRICCQGARIDVHVPHPRHDSFISDPTHVRIITPQVLNMFSKKQNHVWQEMGASNTQLGLYLNVDFEVREANQLLAEPYSTLHAQGELTAEKLEGYIQQRNNVISEYQIVLEVIK